MSRRPLKLYTHAVIASGGTIVVCSVAVLPWMPHPLAWFLFAAPAILTGSFTLRIASVEEASVSVSDTFFIASALLFGPGPATVAAYPNTFSTSPAG